MRRLRVKWKSEDRPGYLQKQRALPSSQRVVANAKAKRLRAKWKRSDPKGWRERVSAANAKFRAAHRERHNAEMKAWRLANPEKVREAQRKTNARPERKAAVRERHLHQKYGLSSADVEARILAQHGLCAVCNEPPPAEKPTLHVDHDHTTGKVRGMLCYACNLSIGKMGDSALRLRAAADYLDAHCTQ